ncbi:hypothetical protein DF947_10840 [Pedobacter paludis]|uniref:Uncharacterized protein n=1 Tax=Pedobacter paludis TaxID=2203212 RepID=A0A317F448_9SPHI|nr:hypothetical protein DF947_10840 [Pedobacter paludis]
MISNYSLAEIAFSGGQRNNVWFFVIYLSYLTIFFIRFGKYQSDYEIQTFKHDVIWPAFR